MNTRSKVGNGRREYGSHASRKDSLIRAIMAKPSHPQRYSRFAPRRDLPPTEEKYSQAKTGQSAPALPRSNRWRSPALFSKSAAANKLSRRLPAHASNKK